MCGVCLANEVYDLITWLNVQNITNSLFVLPLYEIPNINQMTLFQAKTFPNSNYLYCTCNRNRRTIFNVYDEVFGRFSYQSSTPQLAGRGLSPKRIMTVKFKLSSLKFITIKGRILSVRIED